MREIYPLYVPSVKSLSLLQIISISVTFTSRLPPGLVSGSHLYRHIKTCQTSLILPTNCGNLYLQADSFLHRNDLRGTSPVESRADLTALETQYQFGTDDKIIRFTRPGRMTRNEMPIFKSRNARNKVITTDIFKKHSLLTLYLHLPLLSDIQ